MRITFSTLAEVDLVEIANYTVRTWGTEQAESYLLGLEQLCSRLLDLPELGRSANAVMNGLRRLEYDRHVIFYRQLGENIRVERVLHQTMLPDRQPFPD